MPPFNTIDEAAFELTGDGIVVVRDGSVISTNGTFLRMLDRQRDSIVNRPFDTLLAPQARSAFMNSSEKVLAVGSTDTFRTALMHQQGHAIQVECSLRPAELDDYDVLFIFIRDISSINRLEQELKLTTDKLVFFGKWVRKGSAEIIEMNQRLSNEVKRRDIAEKMKDDSDRRFRTIAETIPEVFWIYSHHEKKLLYVSPAFERIYDRPSEEYYRNPDLWREVIHPDDMDIVRESLDNYFGKERELEYRILRPDWSICWIRDRIFPVRNAAGEIIHIVGFCEDITDRKRLEEDLRKLSVTDGLTGLFNHQHFFHMINEEVERAKRISYPLSLIMFDIDSFKKYNDVHGHLKADDVLREVGRLTQQIIRSAVDTAFRYGGDEFIIISPNTTHEGAAALETRLRDTIRQHTPDIEISAGIALLSEGQSIEEFIEAADSAMYLNKVKSAGS
jgi:diguanylate cyclase (GGDEF)-like protein/PAS domain S-box-containing protein